MQIRVVTARPTAAWLVFLLAAIVLLGALPGLGQDKFLGAERPKRLFESAVADMARWPFGTAEKRIETDAANSSRMAFLRREIGKGFPINEAWRAALELARNKGGFDLLSTVNRLVNKTPYVHEKSDRWKAPAAFLSEGGDCDCFAVSKYLLLRDLGFPAGDLRITGIQLRKNNRLHAILVARTGPRQSEKFVLDNIGNDVRTAIYTDEYVPLLSLNEDGVWMHDSRARALIQTFTNPPVP